MHAVYLIVEHSSLSFVKVLKICCMNGGTSAHKARQVHNSSLGPLRSPLEGILLENFEILES